MDHHFKTLGIRYNRWKFFTWSTEHIERSWFMSSTTEIIYMNKPSRMHPPRASPKHYYLPERCRSFAPVSRRSSKSSYRHHNYSSMIITTCKFRNISKYPTTALRWWQSSASCFYYGQISPFPLFMEWLT